MLRLLPTVLLCAVASLPLNLEAQSRIRLNRAGAVMPGRLPVLGAPNFNVPWQAYGPFPGEQYTIVPPFTWAAPIYPAPIVAAPIYLAPLYTSSPYIFVPPEIPSTPSEVSELSDEVRRLGREVKQLRQEKGRQT